MTSNKYEHRNGETELPEWENYYWFSGVLDSGSESQDLGKHHPIPVHMTSYHPSPPGEDKVVALFGEEGCFYLACFKGRWWGPIPWPDEFEVKIAPKKDGN